MEVLCPWCEEKTKPVEKISDKENGQVREKRCEKCNKILAAYLVDEGDFLSRIRKFEN